MPLRSALFLLSCTPMMCGAAAAPEGGKVWLDETCHVRLESHPEASVAAFVISTTDGSYKNSCRVYDWPLDHPQATMACADNAAPTMELQGKNVVFEGLNLLASGNSRITLFPEGDSRANCG